MSAEKTELVQIRIDKKVLDELKELDKKHNPAYDEGFIAEDWAGGNFDDAHSIGMSHGEIDLAQRVIAAIVE